MPETSATTPPNNSTDSALREALANRADEIAALRVAHEAAMVEDAREVLKQNRATVRAHGREFLGMSEADETGEMIHVGDVHNTTTTPQAAASGVSPYLMAAGMAAAGLGGAAIPMAAGTLLTKVDPAPIVQPAAPTTPGTDTRNLLRLRPPE